MTRQLQVAHGGLMLIGMARLLTKLKPTRRWMQLSLQTVLVLVTLLCVALPNCRITGP